ncbi:MAG: TetR/AcrR family transcriptional regulator [Pseudomonadota bacterium]
MKKKQKIIKEAIRLFAERGFDATTTLKIAEVSHVTEPLIFYHFKNKDGLFTEAIECIFFEYFSRLESLAVKTESEFENLENLIHMHFDYVAEMPNESYLLTSVRPVRLRDFESVCIRNMEEQRNRLNTFIAGCLKRGIRKKEFWNVPVEPTVRLFISSLIGLMRQGILFLSDRETDHERIISELKEVAAMYCRRSLVKE